MDLHETFNMGPSGLVLGGGIIRISAKPPRTAPGSVLVNRFDHVKYIDIIKKYEWKIDAREHPAADFK
jgi:hypothetical protein